MNMTLSHLQARLAEIAATQSPHVETNIVDVAIDDHRCRRVVLEPASTPEHEPPSCTCSEDCECSDYSGENDRIEELEKEIHRLCVSHSSILYEKNREISFLREKNEEILQTNARLGFHVEMLKTWIEDILSRP